MDVDRVSLSSSSENDFEGFSTSNDDEEEPPDPDKLREKSYCKLFPNKCGRKGKLIDFFSVLDKVFR